MSTRTVHLDLPEDNNSERYVALTLALQEYASAMEFKADGEDESDAYNGGEVGGPQAESFRRTAAVARELLEEIEAQLDA